MVRAKGAIKTNLRRLLLRLIRSLPESAIARLSERFSRWSMLGGLAQRTLSWAGGGKAGLTDEVTQLRHGPGRGLRIASAGSALGYVLGTNEPKVQQLLADALRPGGVFYDIGANIGFFTIISARLVGDQGRVLAFEPVPAQAIAVRRNADLNNFSQIEVVEKAAYSRDDRLTLVLLDDNVSAHLEQFSDRLRSIGVNNGAIGTIQVDAVTLDGMRDRGAPAPTVVKIDVEGAELGVLEGMRGILERDQPLVICELHGTQGEVASLFEGTGYTLEILEQPGIAVAEAAALTHLVARPAMTTSKHGDVASR